jgi:tripartite-type tricarboxylate transporter receptor subunit TctC
MTKIMKTVVSATLLMGMATAAMAQTAPNCSTAQLIVPWGAGGDTDVVLRTIAEAVSNAGDVTLQVVNVPGQGGNLGAKQAAAAAPDGCTLFAIHQSALTSYLTGRVEFAHEAFEPVALMVSTPAIYGSSKDAPFTTLPELIAYAKENPGEVLAGSTLGSTSHFAILLLEDAAGVKFRHIGYEGTRERMTALLAGTIQLAEINLAASAQYIQSAELGSLAITSEERHPDAPTVPTATEMGAPVLYGTDRGVVLPKGTDPEIVSYWIDAMKTASEDPAFAEKIAGLGSTVKYVGGADYQAYFDQTLEKWTSIAKDVGVYNPIN